MSVTENAPTLDHRERLLRGMAASVREKGFRGTTIADVVAHARVSRRTFYEHFSDPTDCYLALFERITRQNMATISEAMTAQGPLGERLDRALSGYLGTLASDPELSRSYFRELHNTGDRGRRLLRAVKERAGQTIHELTEQERARDPERLHSLSPAMATMISTGIAEMALLALDDGASLEPVKATATQLLLRVLAAPDPD
ncbi:MAG TPA: TetR/AcrR family transcriptional regulator [Solirubrobacteraceae bacterium]|jgi:AcrR family transcriptional regulator|nr:TetR/AcrR family transcriptional regulator [Solirubrobacteraceae bacterium]